MANIFLLALIIVILVFKRFCCICYLL
uniref:Uncharacterized protein n=1 Tax=Arundo donax TaxID=35708 RepID=A0A0A9DWF5_ARUDO